MEEGFKAGLGGGLTRRGILVNVGQNMYTQKKYKTKDGGEEFL